MHDAPVIAHSISRCSSVKQQTGLTFSLCCLLIRLPLLKLICCNETVLSAYSNSETAMIRSSLCN